MDRLLVSGGTLRNIAKQFAVSATTLHRHKEHLPRQLVAAKQAAETAAAGNLLDTVKSLLTDAQRITKHAEQAKQYDVALKGIREVRGVIELLGKVSSELTTQRIAAEQATFIEPKSREEVERRIAALLSGSIAEEIAHTP